MSLALNSFMVFKPQPTSPTPAFASPNPSQASVQWQICQVFGHSARDCLHRTHFAYTTTDISNNMAALSLQDNGDRAWYMDTGASSHMTYD